jgi:hypothetical protein
MPPREFPRKTFKQILAEQDAFTTRMYSLPISCPLCGHAFSLVEYHDGPEAWARLQADVENGMSTWDDVHVVDCPGCRLTLRHEVAIIGGSQFWSIEPNQKVTYAGRTFEIGKGTVEISP